VLLEVPNGTYWKSWARFMADEVATRGLISPDDEVLYRITDDVREATEEITNFYRNYHSIRYVGDLLVVRLRAQPTPDEVAVLDQAFRDICLSGGIRAIEPTPAEQSTNDHLDLGRIAFRFDRVHHGRLRELIDAVNRLASAPPVPAAPPRKDEQAAVQT
jgi:hypothetical protein